jgi:hypothetical protein
MSMCPSTDKSIDTWLNRPATELFFIPYDGSYAETLVEDDAVVPLP